MKNADTERCCIDALLHCMLGPICLHCLSITSLHMCIALTSSWLPSCSSALTECDPISTAACSLGDAPCALAAAWYLVSMSSSTEAHASASLLLQCAAWLVMGSWAAERSAGVSSFVNAAVHSSFKLQAMGRFTSQARCGRGCLTKLYEGFRSCERTRNIMVRKTYYSIAIILEYRIRVWYRLPVNSHNNSAAMLQRTSLSSPVPRSQYCCSDFAGSPDRVSAMKG